MADLLTAGQRACINTLDAPIAVSAGAGSGKTFTLTKRIVNALETGYLNSVDEVLAITFTNKAAGEIKSRVKSSLRASGLSSEALKVDDAWISTIHGMCGRILRAHALELGIAPDFQMAPEELVDALLNQAIDEVLGGNDDVVYSAYDIDGLDALFSEFPVRAQGFSGGSVEEMVRSLVEAASASPKGMACIVLPPQVEKTPTQLLMEFRDAALLASDLAQALKPSKNSLGKREEFLDNNQAALDKLDRLLSSQVPNYADALAAMAQFVLPPGNIGSKESPYRLQLPSIRHTYAELATQARAGYLQPFVHTLFALAGAVFERFVTLKHDARVLDNNDLLTLAARAIDENPHIANEYCNKFKLVMVDEFQDTDALQLAMIRRLSGDGFTRMCTVGDAQQSIYRFRGADISLFRKHLADVEAANPGGVIRLDDNFRSHAAVLKFCDCVFPQPDVFGSEFMSLRPGRDEGRVRVPYLGSSARVQVQLTAYKPSTMRSRGVASNEAVYTCATRLANTFAHLREEGHSLDSMVLLLGRMKNANVFAEVFRKHGLPCVISGGTTFKNAPEVQLALRLAQALTNPHWTAALFEVLSSPMFALSADDLLELSTCFDEVQQVPKRRSLARGFSDCMQNCREGKCQSEALNHVCEVFSYAFEQIRFRPLSAVMEYVLVESGELARLEECGPEGLAKAANLYKVLRMAQDIERSTCAGPSLVAKQLQARVELSKEGPGALSAGSEGFIRIMTVHASKGLEFPIVALAEMREDTLRPSVLRMSSIGGKNYISLDGGAYLSDFKDTMLGKQEVKTYPLPDGLGLDELLTCIPKEENPAKLRSEISAYEQQGEAAEQRRLLYVALTRAKEALIVCMCGKLGSMDAVVGGKKTKVCGPKLTNSVYGCIQSALVGQGSFFDAGVSMLDYGGEAPACVERVDMTLDGETEQVLIDGVSKDDWEQRLFLGKDVCVDDAAAHTVSLPRVRPFVSLCDCVWWPSRGLVYSYSSLHCLQDEDAYATYTQSHGSIGAVQQSEDDLAWAEINESLKDSDAATNFGTAFHRLAQRAVLERSKGKPPVCPDGQAIVVQVRAMNLDGFHAERLYEALDTWFSSELCKRVGTYQNVYAEVPFFAPFLDQVQHANKQRAEKPLDFKSNEVPFLQGEMDLLAFNEVGGSALLVDYKTGGLASETDAQLHEKHALQAMCYAYVLLRAGFSKVEAQFVRVEQKTAQGEPQAVCYEFLRDGYDALESEILACYPKGE